MRPSGISEKILSSAFNFLCDWEDGLLTLDDCLDRLRRENGPERPAVASLLFEYFRHKGFIDEMIAKHARKGLVRKEMRLLVSCALTQMYYQTGLAPESAVNIAVEFAKARNGHGGGSFVNAILRSILRDKSVKTRCNAPSFPKPLRERWNQRFGEERANEIIQHYASNPPLTFRLRKEVELPEALAAKSVEGLDFTGDFRFFETTENSALFECGLLDQGAIYIQDPATCMWLSLLPEQITGRALDACAAPGGKTILLHDHSPKAVLTAIDRSSKRILPLNQNLRRAGVRCRTLDCDACETPFSPESFDCILADVPCSNTGVLRRRPDAPWRFTEKNLNELKGMQKRILDSLATLVRPGGYLIYSTCSIEEEEDRTQVDAFLYRNGRFELVKDRLLFPDAAHDGAYCAVMKKR